MASPAITVVLALVVTAAQGQEPYTITPINNTGILFENLGSLLVYHQTWQVITELDLGELKAQTALAERAENLVYGICVEQETKENLCGVQQRQIHSMLDHIRGRTSTVQELVLQPRPKRSLFDGIGNAMHYLFGTMDSTNEQELYSRVGTLEGDQQTLLELEKQQISVVTAALRKIQKPLVALQDRQQQIAHRINDLQNVTDELHQRQTRLEIVSSLLLQVVEIEFRQQALLDIVLSGANNHIHPLLISPKTLTHIYEKTGATCPDSCWTVLNQVVEISYFMVQDKIVFKLALPIFEGRPMKIRRVYCFPILKSPQHSLLPDIEYTYVADRINTQEFLLIRAEHWDEYKKVTHTARNSLYVGRPKTPIIRASKSKECLIKMIFNPLQEGYKCPLRAQIPPKSVLIKMHRTNAWLYSLIVPQQVQITCPHKDMTTQLAGTGIVQINEPCQVRIDSMVLKYQGGHQNPLKVEQPSYFQDDPYTQLNLIPLLNKSLHQKTLHLIPVANANALLRSEARSLEEIQLELNRLQEKSRGRTQGTLVLASLSTTGIILLVLAAWAALKITPLILQWGQTHLRQGQSGANSPAPRGTDEIELQPPKPAKRNDLRRSKSLPRQRSVQLV